MTNKDSGGQGVNLLKKIDRVFKDYFDIDQKPESLFNNEKALDKAQAGQFKSLLSEKLNDKNNKRIYSLKELTEDVLSGLQHRDLEKIDQKFLIKGKHLQVMNIAKDKKKLKNTCDFAKRIIKNNDVLLRVKGQIGPAVLITEDEAGMYYYNDLVRIRVDMDQIIPQYLSLYLNSFIGKHFLNKNAKSKSMNYINITSVKEIPVLRPMIIDQWKIVKKYFTMKSIQKIEEID
jgi:restriction endonuclease S subunit